MNNTAIIDNNQNLNGERTMRLFYVAYTRARHSLAIAIYTDNPEIIKQTVTRNGWFDSAEISIM